MASLSPEAFEDDLRLHTKFGYHVQFIFYVHSVVAVFMDLIPIVIGLILFMYPEIHRQSAVYPQFFQVTSNAICWTTFDFKYYDRIHAYQYYIVYNSTIFIWILLHFLHVLAIGISIFGVRLHKPYLMLPQLMFLVFRIGLLLLLFCFLITFVNLSSKAYTFVVFRILLALSWPSIQRWLSFC